MHAQRAIRSVRNRIPPIIDRSDEEEILLKRWAADDGDFVEDEFDCDDALDAALGIQRAAFRPGIER